MTLVSPAGHLLRVNRSLCQFLGYSAEELLAKTFQDITHPLYWKAIWPMWRRCSRATFALIKWKSATSPRAAKWSGRF